MTNTALEAPLRRAATIKLTYKERPDSVGYLLRLCIVLLKIANDAEISLFDL